MSNTDGLDVPAKRQKTQEAFWSFVSQWTRRQLSGLLEQVLLSEQQEWIAAGWNERKSGRAGWRNGFYRRQLLSPHGPLQVKVPRCRSSGLDCSLMFNRYQRRVQDVDRILRHAFLLGASTRGTAELAEQVFGGQISHQTVSRSLRWLDERLQQWRAQPIEPIYKVVYIDGMHVNCIEGDRMVMLVAGQREAQGPLEVLDFCVSSGERCLDLLRSLRRRGLEGVELIVSDESGAIRHAVEEVYPEVAWQHCTFHRLQALRNNIGTTDFRDAMVADAAEIFRCPTKLAAQERSLAWAGQWRQRAAWAVQQFMDDLDDSLMFYSLPKDWWKRVRTNNPMERLIRTLRMRLQPMGCFHDGPAIERAVFGQLARWHLLGTYTQ
jgi:transposase-like protein